VDIEIPTDRLNVIEDSQACHAAYKAKGHIDRLIN
jgi:hypothetical protein